MDEPGTWPMIRYLKFRAKSSAEKRSKELWAHKLGRPVEPGEDTTHLYGWTRSHKSYGGSMLIVKDDGDLLTADEKEDLGEVGDEEWVEWTEKYQPEPD